MFILRRIIIFAVPVLLAAWLELVKVRPGFLWPGAVLFFLYLAFACFLVCQGRFGKVFGHFLILPFLFSLSCFSFALFLVNSAAFHVTVVFGAAVLYLVVKQYFVYFYIPLRYQAYSLENLNFYITLLTAFFLFACGFAAVILLQLNLAAVAAGVMPIFALLLYQMFWTHKVDLGKSWILFVSITLMAAELFIALAYLPTGYYVDAFALTALIYMMLGLSRLYVQGSLEKKKVWVFITVGAIALLGVLATAQWG